MATRRRSRPALTTSLTRCVRTCREIPQSRRSRPRRHQRTSSRLLLLSGRRQRTRINRHFRAIRPVDSPDVVGAIEVQPPSER